MKNKMNVKNILLLLSIFVFSLTCEEPTLPNDCLGNEGGSAYIDECGVCDDDANNDNITCFDCSGELNGIYIYDECNICDTYSTYGGIKPSYPYGSCDCAGLLEGTATTDNCGVCDSDTSNNCTQDCAGTWGGTAVNDNCDVCNGDSTSCEQDCVGTWGGTAVNDNCGVCDSNTSNNCTQDCEGTWGGTAVNDNCGVCNGDSTSCIAGCTDQAACNYDASIDTLNDDGSCSFAEENYNCAGDCIAELDCYNECGGTAIIDCSGECRGGSTGLLAYTLCACFDTTADNFYCHQDAGECYNNPGVNTCCENNISVDESCNADCIISDDISSSLYSNPFIDSIDCEFSPNPTTSNQGCVNNYENPNYGLVYNDTSLCEYYGCTDDTLSNYDSNATNCEDGTSSCCRTVDYIEIQNIDLDNKTFEIFMDNSVDVGGFQLDFLNVELSEASGGTAEDAGFAVSASNTRILGFSFSGAIIPPGSALLTTVGYSVNNSACISSITTSDVNGEALSLIIHQNSLCSE